MQKVLQDKRAVLMLAGLALLSLILLTNMVSRMEFLPSQPIGGALPGQVTSQPLNVADLLKIVVDVPLWKQLTFFIVLFLILLLITSLLSPEQRKKIILAFLRIAGSALIMLYIIKKQPELFAGFLLQFAGMVQNPLGPTPVDTSPAPVFQPPQEVDWLSFVITLGVILMAALLIWQANRFWIQLRQGNTSSASLDKIAAIARHSLNDLKAGRNYDNAIVECYERMSDVIARKQGLQRAQAMTASEFAARLTRAGLPRDPIQTLTSLFESARYGKQPVTQREINEAINCLTSILVHCGETA